MLTSKINKNNLTYKKEPEWLNVNYKYILGTKKTKQLDLWVPKKASQHVLALNMALAAKQNIKIHL